MADITIYKPSTVTVQVIDGTPPDLTPLQAQLDAANQTIATLNAKITAARAKAQADKDADNASVAGQGVLDALA